MWDYNLANIQAIRNHLNNINWEVLFLNKSPDEMVEVFNNVFLVTMATFIPNKIVTINDKDAPWVTPEVKSALRRNSRLYNKWVKNDRIHSSKDVVNRSQMDTNKLVEKAKARHTKDLCAKLLDRRNGQKVFWSAYKRLLNKKKMSNIPPILENNEFISDFKSKANICNHYFAMQCRPLDILSYLPTFLLERIFL